MWPLHNTNEGESDTFIMPLLLSGVMYWLSWPGGAQVLLLSTMLPFSVGGFPAHTWLDRFCYHVLLLNKDAPSVQLLVNQSMVNGNCVVTPLWLLTYRNIVGANPNLNPNPISIVDSAPWIALSKPKLKLRADPPISLTWELTDSMTSYVWCACCNTDLLAPWSN